jgi:hypothetical protein
MRTALVTCCVLVVGSWLSASAQELAVHAPPKSIAGAGVTISTTGRGSAAFYLIGPSRALRRSIELGEGIPIPGSDVAVSGVYQAIACGSTCVSTSFQVIPAAPAKLNFLLHPSRVPVSSGNAINASAFVFDRFHNTVTKPTKVDFHISLPNGPTMTRTGETIRGITWFEMGSTPKQGRLQIIASIGETAEPRVIQQVASDACGLRMTATPSGRYVKLETAAIRDCAGNALPDGTIVSFTKTDDAGRSTIDTPIKKDKATAQFELAGRARISVACGVALGNELEVEGRP